MTLISHVVVLGGGAAGWLAANHLAKKLESKEPCSVKVTLVESPNIPTIGVGEGTVPAIRKTLHYLGINEADFIRECDATFKQSIKFVDWEVPPSEGRSSHYHHLFDYPCIQPFDLTPYWVLGEFNELSFAEVVSKQSLICDSGLGPKNMLHAEFDGSVHYAYHLDAAKFSHLLTKHAVNNLGVKHVKANVIDVDVNEFGNIVSVETDQGIIAADFFVDCTGFSALLIEKKLGVKFIDKSDMLFADHALAVQVPYADESSPIPCFTQSTAKEAGWIWDIGLTARRGVGYVYSSNHTTHEQAERVLREYVNDDRGNLSVRQIPMRVGYREKFWINNCVAIGLAQGFVEPLEATGLLVYDATARMLADLFPATFPEIQYAAEQFNSLTKNAWDKVIDFVKLHYFITKRSDSDFWLDNRNSTTASDRLLSLLDAWRCRVPTEYDFSSRMEIFNLENYLYVLYGMNYQTTLENRRSRYNQKDYARGIQSYIRRESIEHGKALLPHRELIERIKKYGIQ